jgi:hypothetical protein
MGNPFPAEPDWVTGTQQDNPVIFIISHTNSPTMTARSPMSVPEAAHMLGIAERASLNGIHARFRELAKEWHPDVSQHDPARSHDRFIRIKEAYDILVEYGMNYELSFRAEDIRKGTDYDSQEFWMAHFGDDPIWG